jgi:hypothetical protein
MLLFNLAYPAAAAGGDPAYPVFFGYDRMCQRININSSCSPPVTSAEPRQLKQLLWA